MLSPYMVLSNEKTVYFMQFGNIDGSTTLYMRDEQNPYKGVIVRMSSSGKEHNCSLSVSVICDST